MASMPGYVTSGPPYTPRVAQVGGRPTVKVDVPISAVLIFLFVIGAAVHLTILRLNLRQESRRIFSFLNFIFCIIRSVALAMRIAWAAHINDVNLAIAAQVFTMAGVLILFVVNLVFVRRFLRAYAVFGRHLLVQMLYVFLLFCVAAMLVMVVTVSVYSFFTLDEEKRKICREVQRVAITYLAALAFIPIPAVLVGLCFPRKSHVDKLRRRAKVQLLLFTSTLLSLGAGFRCGTTFDQRPITQPAWFHHKACYYCFNFAIEIIVVYSFAISRVDPRFRLDRTDTAGLKVAGIKPEQAGQSRIPLNTEAEVYGFDGENEQDTAEGTRAAEWANKAQAEFQHEGPAL
ncbi:Family c-likeg-protein-coupled receptor protein [Pleurostoma richardsiae]|uniref:Family c-likeg-protein-coupled receptor protein n=1 Tax=Pleurostoma richardsiae TaxID=41990 RepID=A0AA38RFA3_9PEZI|nr:Family c-likeg-protein-coupled receptor protein [Pleurostoma richardsiae]